MGKIGSINQFFPKSLIQVSAGLFTPQTKGIIKNQGEVKLFS